MKLRVTINLDVPDQFAISVQVQINKWVSSALDAWEYNLGVKGTFLIEEQEEGKGEG